MLLKIKIFMFLMLFSAGIAFAGEVLKFVCDRCGFQSNDLFIGSGDLNRENIVVYCDKCKNFYAITPSVTHSEENVLEKEGKKIYPCPKCNSKAVVYKSKVCPICKKGTLRRQFLGLWD